MYLSNHGYNYLHTGKLVIPVITVGKLVPLRLERAMGYLMPKDVGRVRTWTAHFFSTLPLHCTVTHCRSNHLRGTFSSLMSSMLLT